MRSPEELLHAARRIDPGRVRGGLAVGLRDAALLALVASGVRAGLIASLQATQIGVHRDGRLEITTPADSEGWERRKVLSPVASSLLLAWLAEARAWAQPVPVFYTIDRAGEQRPLTVKAVHGVLERVRRGRKRA